jgi:hypothetical protein
LLRLPTKYVPHDSAATKRNKKKNATRTRVFAFRSKGVSTIWAPLSRLVYRPFFCLATIVHRNAKKDAPMLNRPGADHLRLTPVHDTVWAVRLPKHLPSSKLCAASATLVFVPAMEPNFRLHNSCGARLARASRARLGISVRKNFEPGWPLDISQRPFFEPGLCLARAAGCSDEPTYSHLSRFPDL